MFFFLSEFFQSLDVNFSIYLNKRVFITHYLFLISPFFNGRNKKAMLRGCSISWVPSLIFLDNSSLR